MVNLSTYGALDALPALVFVTDAAGCNVFSNAKYEQYAGRTRHALRGEPWLAALHPDDRQRARERWLQAQARAVFEGEYRLRRHDERYRWHLCRAEAFRAGDDAIVRWSFTCVDIEARRRAAESQAWLAAIVAASDDAIVSKTLDGTIRSWNAGAERMFGYAAAETIGRSGTLIIPPDRLDEEREILERVRRGEPVEHIETVRVARGGRRVDVSMTISPVLDDDGRVIGASKVARDITRRKQVEEALTASRAELRLVADHAAVMLAHCDADKRYLFVNLAYVERFGLDPAQVVGMRIPDLLGADAYAAIEPYIRRVLSGELVQFETEVRYADLGARFMHCVYVPEFDATGGSVRGFVAAISDITERRHLEERLREADRRKDEFLAILGHELRNPLAPLGTGLQLLQHADQDAAVVEQVRQVMQRQLAHLVRLVDDLVDVSRIGQGMIELKRGPLTLNAVLDTAIELAQPLIDQRGHRLVVERADDALSLDGDFERLTQVIGNLLGNAAKYTKPGGEIRLRGEQRDDRAVVRVSDNGLGIAAGQLAVIFDMFSQLPEHRDDGSSRGLGLGLALSRQLVELHGGSLEAKSAGPGHGSEFIVRLPLTGRPTEARPSGSEPSSSEVEPRRILVVDDNVDAANGLRMVLAAQGHEAQAVHDGLAALERIPTFAPHVILLDIGLPGLDGYEVARRIRASVNGAGTVLIALTGWGRLRDKQRAEEAGFDAHVTKPVNSQQLREILAACGRAGHASA